MPRYSNQHDGKQRKQSGVSPPNLPSIRPSRKRKRKRKRKKKKENPPALIVLPHAGRHDGPDDAPVAHGGRLLPGGERVDVALREDHIAVVRDIRPVLLEVDLVPGEQESLPGVRAQEVRRHWRPEFVRRRGLGAEHHLLQEHPSSQLAGNFPHEFTRSRSLAVFVHKPWCGIRHWTPTKKQNENQKKRREVSPKYAADKQASDRDIFESALSKL